MRGPWPLPCLAKRKLAPCRKNFLKHILRNPAQTSCHLEQSGPVLRWKERWLLCGWVQPSMIWERMGSVSSSSFFRRRSRRLRLGRGLQSCTLFVRVVGWVVVVVVMGVVLVA